MEVTYFQVQDEFQYAYCTLIAKEITIKLPLK